MRSSEREIARAMSMISGRAARATRATWRGNVDTVNEDGSANVKLPNGGVIKVQPSNLFDFTDGQSVTLLRTGSQYEAMGPSAYQGGLGAPFDPPE